MLTNEQANLKSFNANPNDNAILDAVDSQIDNELLQALQAQVHTGNLKDFYKVGLFGYCSGDIDASGKETVTYCSPRKTGFYFDPEEVWDLNNTVAEAAFPKEYHDGINAYRKVAKWMFAAYAAAIGLTAGAILVGISALFSRWGSLATTIVQTVGPARPASSLYSRQAHISRSCKSFSTSAPLPLPLLCMPPLSASSTPS